jgi:hypothetical protein
LPGQEAQLRTFRGFQVGEKFEFGFDLVP